MALREEDPPPIIQPRRGVHQCMLGLMDTLKQLGDLHPRLILFTHIFQSQNHKGQER